MSNTLLYVAGQYANLLETARAVTMTPSEDSNFPSENLYDNRAGHAARHLDTTADPSVTVDLAPFAPFKNSNTTYSARAGQRRVASVTGGAANVTVQNLATGKYLTSGGTWQTASTYCLTGTGTVEYTVEPLSTCKVPTVSLKMTVNNDAGDGCDWPQWNTIAVIGHNLEPFMTVKMRSSTDNFSSSDVEVATATINQPSFFVYNATALVTRYARLKITGTPLTAPWYGELMVCYLETAASCPDIGYQIAHDFNEIRNQGRFGVTHVYSMSDHPYRTVKLSFGVSSSDQSEIRDEIVKRARGGAYPVLIVPVNSESDVFYGRLTSKWVEMRKFMTYWESDLIFVEDPCAVPLG